MSALMSSTYLLYKRSRLWFYGTVFCFYYMFILVWQTPWAVLTAWRNEWITRS
jgi:hyaluronan synthase